MRRLCGLLLFVAAATLPQTAAAWNALGHKVIADIAWRQLTQEQRTEIVDTLRRHPRFDDDFAKEMPRVADDARWIFHHAATWPDIARGLPEGPRKVYDQPTWHYVNFPLFVGPERPVAFNVSMRRADQPDKAKYNVAQAVELCRDVIAGDAQPKTKAVAYCWLFHLVGDLHQPMHSTALVCDRLPEGDRGGNSIPLVQGKNLHALWDNLLGRQHRESDVLREVKELQATPALWKVETQPDVEAWIAESHDLAKSFAYGPVIIAAVQREGELAPISLPRSYLTAAGAKARGRVVAAGLRLGVLLGGSAEAELDVPPPDVEPELFAETAATPPARTTTPSRDVETELTHWLNLNGGVRHNASCRWYQNTKRGRMCTADEGRACGQCGG